jgi:hypothetical protein
MLFRQRFHGPIARGEVTLTVRSWARPQAKPGGRYRVGDTVIEVTGLAQAPLASLTESHAKRAGFASVDELLVELGRHSRGSVGSDATAWLIEFRAVGAYEAPSPAPVSADALAAARGRLDALDRLRGRAWTQRALALIGERPATPARLLAAEMGMETLPFKVDVRKLKALGLTTSLDVGYELTDLGRAALGERVM